MMIVLFPLTILVGKGWAGVFKVWPITVTKGPQPGSDEWLRYWIPTVRTKGES